MTATCVLTSSAPPGTLSWFFDPFVPDVVTVTGSPHTADLHDEPWEQVPTPVLLAEQQRQQFQAGHFPEMAESYAHFPGFTNEIQGVFPEQGEDGRVRLFTYVIRE